MASQIVDRIETVRSSPERDETVEHVIDMEGRRHKRGACIFKVNQGLLRTNSYAYTPSFISIGPYHYEEEHSILRKEHLKREYLQSFLERTNNSPLTEEELLGILKSLEPRARACYDDPIRMEADEFVKMLLLDGCFVVEFFIRSEEDKQKFSKGNNKKSGTIPKVDDWTEAQVLRDMLLMENQLPFVVLNKIYQTIENVVPFFKLVRVTFLHMSPKLRYFSLIYNEDVNNNENEIKHLLQVMHILCFPVNERQSQASAGDVSTIESCLIRIGSSLQEAGVRFKKHLLQVMHILCFPVNERRRKSQESAGDESSIESCHIRSASELQEAGVRFKKVGDINDNSLSNPHLTDIKFNDGVLEIPSFKLDASAETLFRNLIFYEQRSIDMHPKYLSEYAVFMDNLINTEKDVSILRLKGIIINGLGDDKKVADLFNTLSHEVVYSYLHFYHAGVSSKLIIHCKKPWNVLKAKLRHDYFYTPWAGISTFAAILLLLLTAAQTVASFLGLNN